MSRDIQQLERFIAEHPTQARFLSCGIAIALLELALLLEQGLIWLAK